jgi:hypothetical protein
MDSRRRGRPSQVRPRPPSTGRPAPVRMRPVGPTKTRLSGYRKIRRGPGLPASAKLLLAIALACLAVVVALFATGTFGRAMGTLLGGIGGVAEQVGSAVGASPSATAAQVVKDVPLIVAPANPYVNTDTVDIRVTVPTAAVGKSAFRVRLFDTVADKPAATLAELPVGQTAELLFPGIALTAGTNDLQVALVGPDGEGGRSSTVTYVLDQVAPKVTITAPKDGSSTTADTITIKGTTQPASTIVAHNDANSASGTGTADKDGIFSVGVSTAEGLNTITLAVTDPAGNASSVVVHVTKGTGKLTVALTGTTYKFKTSTLPTSVTFTVVVSGASGTRLAGATALFTVSIPGLPAIVSPQVTTGGDGTARFTTTIPAGAQSGTGLASVLVTAPSGTGTDRQSLTVQ